MSNVLLHQQHTRTELSTPFIFVHLTSNGMEPKSVLPREPRVLQRCAWNFQLHVVDAFNKPIV